MKTAIIVITILIIAGGAGFVVLNNKDDNSAQTDNSSQTSGQQETTESLGQPNEQSSDAVDPNGYAANANVGESVDATDQKEVTISIDDFIFDPTYLKIKKGTKVTWVNNGNIGHTVTSDENSPIGGLDSDILGNGEAYEFTFAEAGLYEYFCVPHPTQMRGVITVVD